VQVFFALVSPEGDTENKSRRKATRQTNLAGRRHGKQVSPEGDTANKFGLGTTTQHYKRF
jgi:hypothetical protein